MHTKVVTCLSPAHVAGLVAVEVSTNGLDFTDSGVQFDFLGPAIQGVQPVLGPERGGTMLTINGANMVQGFSAFCRFGGLVTSPAAWVSATRMTCVTPPMSSGASSVSLLHTLSGDAALSVWPYEYQASVTIFSTGISLTTSFSTIFSTTISLRPLR